jgi:hypothetical protein
MTSTTRVTSCANEIEASTENGSYNEMDLSDDLVYNDEVLVDKLS